MLSKLPVVTVTPEVPGRDYRAASHTCYSVAPPGTGGDGTPPSQPPNGITVPAGTPILLEDRQTDGTYVTSEGVAPPPAGYVCRYEPIWVYVPGQIEPAQQYIIVCTEQ